MPYADPEKQSEYCRLRYQKNKLKNQVGKIKPEPKKKINHIERLKQEISDLQNPQIELEPIPQSNILPIRGGNTYFKNSYPNNSGYA